MNFNMALKELYQGNSIRCIRSKLIITDQTYLDDKLLSIREVESEWEVVEKEKKEQFGIEKAIEYMKIGNKVKRKSSSIVLSLITWPTMIFITNDGKYIIENGTNNYNFNSFDLLSKDWEIYE